MATKEDLNYILSGRITNLQNQPLADLIVRAYDQDPLTPDDPLSEEAVTDAEGTYTIRFSAEALGLEIGGPDVFIRVYRDNRLVGQSPVYRDQRSRITIDLQVDEAIANPEEPRIVQGVVRDPQGILLAGIPIMAFDRDLRNEQLLGQSWTDDEGSYQISYFTRQFRKHEKGSADLVVKAFTAEGKLLATSPAMFNAPPSADINLAISTDAPLPPLFEGDHQYQGFATLLEQRQKPTGEEDRGRQIRLYLARDDRIVNTLVTEVSLRHDGGVVHQHIEPTALVCDVIERGIDLLS